MRYLFANLIDEEMKRDELYRKSLTSKESLINGLQRGNAPPSMQLPTPTLSSWHHQTASPDLAPTPRATNGFHYPAMTPGLSIGVATPYVMTTNQSTQMNSFLPSTLEEGAELENAMYPQSQPSLSVERPNDYFSTRTSLPHSTENNGKMNGTLHETTGEGLLSPSEPDKEEKTRESTSLFGKKFRMNFPKKLGRTSTDSKPAVVDEKSEESDKSSEKEDKVIEDNMYGVIQRIRYDYDEQLQANPGHALNSGITPSLPNETPVLAPPPLTTVIIQEDRPDSGGVADVFRGTVGSLGQEAEHIEKVAPIWLGELLLRVLFTNCKSWYENMLIYAESNATERDCQGFFRPSTVSGPSSGRRECGWVRNSGRRTESSTAILTVASNSRLNANRMLRGKKILAYVAERIEPQGEHHDPHALKPEEYLELCCQNQVSTPFR